MIEVHENKVIIRNPGGIPKGIGVDFITQVSIRRNAIIADIFSRIKKAERIGSGIKRILELVDQADLNKPTIQSDAFFSIKFDRASRQHEVPVCKTPLSALSPYVEVRPGSWLKRVKSQYSVKS